MNISYLALVVVSLVLGLGTQAYIKHTYKKWSKVPIGDTRSGVEIAFDMLQKNDVSNVSGNIIDGNGLNDFYDPRNNTLNLSRANEQGGSVASIAVACHEAGHAVQDAKGYAPEKIRTAIVPVVNFCSAAWIYVLMAGYLLNWLGLVQIAIVLFAATLLFQIITLPVEFNASRRAVAYIEGAGFGEQATRGARSVLTAAALTYVASALVSALQLLYLMGRNRD